MFDTVLIANRGAIACRIVRTLRSLGLRSVAVYSEADADSAHVAMADVAVCIGPAPAAQSYLNAERILQVARETGAGAIHPGYGFLSENPGFAQACEDAGIAFIGPTPEQMRAFGLKHTARALAEAHGVPLLPGSGLLGDVAEALREAEQLCQQELAKLTRQQTLSARVRRLMLEKQGGFPTLQVSARLLNMTPRTLHRRLQDEGTSYRDILEDIRHHLAVEHIKAGKLTLQEVAYMLGYDDLSNFRRAFKRWEGVAPSAFRA